MYNKLFKQIVEQQNVFSFFLFFSCFSRVSRRRQVFVYWIRTEMWFLQNVRRTKSKNGCDYDDDAGDDDAGSDVAAAAASA